MDSDMRPSAKLREDIFLLAAGLGFIVYLVVTTLWDAGAWVVGWFRPGGKAQ